MADRCRIVPLLEELPDADEVAQRLGHLLPFDEEVLHVQPEANELLPGAGLGLSDLVLVVRENEVFPAEV